MKATLSGLLCIGMTSFALLGGCSKSDSDTGGDGGSGGENAGGGGGEASGGKGGTASGGKGGTGGSPAAGGGGGMNSGGAIGGVGGTTPAGGTGGGAVNPLMPAPTVELVVKIPGVGSEGPVWVAGAPGYLLFSDMKDGRLNLYKVDPSKPEAMRAEIFPYKSGAMRPKTNGLAIDKDGNVFVAEESPSGTLRTDPLPAGAVWKFKATAGAPGAPEVVADKFEGANLGKVNDLAVSKKGIVYFTSAWNGGEGKCPSPLNAAYWVNNKVVKKFVSYEAGKEVPKNANGIALSPDERTLYVGDDACYSDQPEGGIYKYPINDDGSVGMGVKFIPEIIVADGIAVDDAGNLYVASNRDQGRAIFVYKPDGKAWGKIPLPANPSNVSFGGTDRKTLYITVGDSIYKTTLPIPGAP